jgi:hypothetical protein
MHANPGSRDDHWVPGDVAQVFATSLTDLPRPEEEPVFRSPLLAQLISAGSTLHGTNDVPFGCPEGGVTNVSPPEALPFQIASEARRQGRPPGERRTCEERPLTGREAIARWGQTPRQ